MKQAITHASENGNYQTPQIPVSRALVAAGPVITLPPGGPEEEGAGPGWEEVVAAFLASGLDSDGTRRAYARHLRRAGRVFEGKSPAELSGRDLTEYRGAVMAADLSPSSQAQALSALRSFLGWVGTIGGHRLPAEVISKALRTPRATVKSRYSIITEREIAAMFGAAPGKRERALLGVLLGAGLRVAEAAALAVADVMEDADGGVVLFVRQGKGRKDRVVPIGADVERLVREYIAETGRYLGDEGPLFLAIDRGAGGRQRPGLSTRSLSRMVVRMAREAGIVAKRVTPHALRHTFATRCLHSGASVVAVSKLLGHASIATTQRYVDHLTASELRANVPALPFPETLAS